MDMQKFIGYGTGVKKSISAHLCNVPNAMEFMKSPRAQW